MDIKMTEEEMNRACLEFVMEISKRIVRANKDLQIYQVERDHAILEAEIAYYQMKMEDMK